MSTILTAAKEFQDACDSGKGWDVCKAYCHADATFSAQAEALGDITTLEAYCEWAKDLLTPVPDGHYHLKFIGADEADASVVAYAVFHGNQSGPGGPVPPTGNEVASDFVYHMVFEGGRIKHMTKIWNDGFALKQLGWA